MKLSAWHKQQGASVEWYNGFDYYDKVYMSKVFTFTPDDGRVIQADEVVKGGTGYGMYESLFCDAINPDLSLYPLTKWYDGKTGYGYLTRGCIRKCPWCIVPRKEGEIRPDKDIEEVLQGNKKAILMDNNVLASDYGLEQIEKIINLGCKVDFNQGLDCRLVTPDIARMLSKVKWIKYIRFSCDTTQNIAPLITVVEYLKKNGVRPRNIFVYILVQDVLDADLRCKVMKELGVIPFAQPYRDYNNTDPTQEQKDFARYVNRKHIFKSTTWQEYNSLIGRC